MTTNSLFYNCRFLSVEFEEPKKGELIECFESEETSIFISYHPLYPEIKRREKSPMNAA